MDAVVASRVNQIAMMLFTRFSPSALS